MKLKYYKPPFEFREPQTDSEGPCIYDRDGHQIAMLFWPTHNATETSDAEQETYRLGRAMAKLLGKREEAPASLGELHYCERSGDLFIKRRAPASVRERARKLVRAIEDATDNLYRPYLPDAMEGLIEREFEAQDGMMRKLESALTLAIGYMECRITSGCMCSPKGKCVAHSQIEELEAILRGE